MKMTMSGWKLKRYASIYFGGLHVYIKKVYNPILHLQEKVPCLLILTHIFSTKCSYPYLQGKNMHPKRAHIVSCLCSGISREKGENLNMIKPVFCLISTICITMSSGKRRGNRGTRKSEKLKTWVFFYSFSSRNIYIPKIDLLPSSFPVLHLCSEQGDAGWRSELLWRCESDDDACINGFSLLERAREKSKSGIRKCTRLVLVAMPKLCWDFLQKFVCVLYHFCVGYPKKVNWRGWQIISL